jgi:fructose-1,6-bisphosphatase II / sedoheptulose-1,7-bisphosphatase
MRNLFKVPVSSDPAWTLDRSLSLDLVRVTESAALAASLQMGRGDAKTADYAAVGAMREVLSGLDIDGTIVIGEGERDEAPMLYIGEKVGKGRGQRHDLALDPLEGTSIVARGGANALSVVAMAEKEGFLHAPDIYMDKIAIGLQGAIVDLDETPAKNLKELAKAKGCAVSDLVVCILDRPRHAELIKQVRSAGARITLISAGDISGIIAATQSGSGVDIYLGIGGAPEGVLAAAALRCMGGFMQGRLLFRDDKEKQRAEQWDIKNINKKYTHEDLVKGDVTFAATGVTNGAVLQGVRRFAGGAETHSVVMRSKTGTVRRISATHNFTRKAPK